MSCSPCLCLEVRGIMDSIRLIEAEEHSGGPAFKGPRRPYCNPICFKNILTIYIYIFEKNTLSAAAILFPV